MRYLLLLIAAFGFAEGVTAQPVANFTGTPLTGCPPMVVSFTDKSSGSPSSWSWTFTGGTPSTSSLQNPTVSYSTPGTYAVSLKVTNSSGSHTKTMTGYVTVYNPPTVSLSATPLATCPGLPISFTPSVTWNATGGGSYYWDFGDGSNSTSGSPTHAYSVGGRSYTVSLTATNSVGCPTTYVANNLISIYAPPQVRFYASDTTLCQANGSTTFTSTTGGSGPFSYNWSFGDGSSSTAGSPISHTYGALGAYTVKLTATDAHGCTDSLRLMNYIHVRSVTAAGNVPSSVCEGTSVVVNSVAPTTNGAIIVWDFGDGSPLAPRDTATHVYRTTGTFSVKMYASVGGCTDTFTQSLTVLPKPNAAFSISPGHFPCPAPSLVSFTALVSGASSYSWKFGDGFTGVGSSTSHTYQTNQLGLVVELTVVGANGCSNTKRDTVSIYSGMLTTLDLDQHGCVPFVAKLHDTLWQPLYGGLYTPVYPFAITSRYWSFGDGSTAGNVARVNHTYSSVGTYNCAHTVTTSNGCVFHDTIVVHVGGHSTVNFTAVPNPVCAGNPIRFYDSSHSPYGPITSWFWDFGDGLNYSILQNPMVAYALADTYSVKLIVSQNGCEDSLIKTDYVRVLDPSSRPRLKVSCDTIGLVHFVDSSINATSVKWYFGDGTTSTAHNPDHQYASAGTYIYSLVAWNSFTGCRDSVFYAVIINNFSVDMSASDSTVCVGDTIVLTPIITGVVANPSLSIATTKWVTSLNTAPLSFSSPPIDPNNFIIFQGGQINVGVRISDNNGCIVQKVRNAFITAGDPTAAFSSTPPVGCAPANITLNDKTSYPQGTSLASARWHFGDGTSATTPFSAIGHFYPRVGSYGISVVITDNMGCTDSLGIPNYLIISRPTAVFVTLGSAACVGTPYNFYNASTPTTGLSYLWNFGDGTTSTLAAPTHAYSVTGTYTVSLVATDGYGCKDTMTKAAGVTVAPRPKAAFTMDDTINVCPPLQVNFTNTSSGATTYQWEFGNGSNSTLTNPSAVYTKPGIFYIRLIAKSNKGCPDTAVGRARVLGYNGVLQYAPLTGCAPLLVNFVADNVPGVSGFIYDFGDGVTQPSTATSVTHLYTKPGPHVPKLTMTDNLGCSAVSVGLDTVKVDGVIAGFTFDPFPGCDSGLVQFTDTSRGAFSQINPVIWKFHDSTISTSAHPQKYYPGPGHYPIILYCSTNTGCKDTFVSEVVFYQRPVINAGVDTLICINDSVMLRPRGGATYTWTPDSTLTCGHCTNPFAFPRAPATYVVVGTDTNGCSNTDTVQISLKYKTITLVAAPDEICSGDTSQFVAEGASVYHWSPPTGLSNADTSSPYVFPMETQHYVLISRLSGCIPDTDFVNLIVHPSPSVEAGPDQTMIAGSTLHLKAEGQGEIVAWRWTPTVGLWTPSQAATDASPKRTTVYSITVSTEYGCTATDSLRIVVLCDNSQVFLPNTFTPDGNGVNDVFYPRGKGIANIDHFRIYNRWGELVFERSNIAVDDKNNGWDGTKAGRALSPDVYVYTVEATCDTGEPIKWKGNVMLLR